MELKHTPGPWKAHKTNQARSGVPEFEIHWSDIGECVAEIVHGEADACLIASAPELLSALIACYDMIAEECADGEYTEQAKLAKEAIAKATGAA